MIGGTDVRIEPAPGGATIAPSTSLVLGTVGRLLGVGWELEAFYGFAAGDPVLGPVTRRLAGLRPPLALEPFEALVGAISAQQISLVVAAGVRNRLIRRFGREVGAAWEFPTEEAVAAADPAELRALGFTQRKAEYVVELARSRLPYGELATLPDDEVKARLVAVRGLGAWTADWYLARHLGRPAAWAPGDLAVRKALAFFYPAGVDVERFEPFQNLAVQYLLAGHRLP